MSHKERMLAVTNDISEGDTKHLKKKDLVEAVRFWAARSDQLAEEKESLKTRLLIFITDLCTEPSPTETEEKR